MSDLTLRTTVLARGPAAAIPLTDDQVAHLSPKKAFPVVVTIGDRTARLRLARMDGENLIGLSRENRGLLGVEAGDEVEAIIAVDHAERSIDVPSDLAEALAAAGMREAFDALAPSRRKEAVRQVNEAKAEATRNRRIAKIVDSLQG